MDLSSKEEIWFKRQTEPAVLENTTTKTLYKALIKKCGSAWNGEEETDKEALERETEAEEEAIHCKFAGEWTVHGPKHFIIRSWFRRCIWALIWMSMVGYSISSCYKVFIEYYQYPTKTSIGLEEENSLEFPAVTVCSLASLTPENGSDWFSSHKLWSSFLQIEQNFGNPTCPQDLYKDDYVDYSKLKDDCLAMNVATMNESQFRECFLINDLGILIEYSLPGNRRKRNIPTNDGELGQNFQPMENPNLDPLLRTRRSSGSYVNPSAADRKFLRLNCDSVYQLYILRQSMLNDSPLPQDFQYGNMSKCPSGYENPKTKYVEDGVCSSTGVFQDPYGFYNRDLYDCKTTISITYNQTKYVCSSCCDYNLECIKEKDFIKENSSNSFSEMTYNALYDKIRKSSFKDGRDLMDDFSPSYQDLLDATVDPDSVISTCSFDQGFCSSKDFLIWPNYRFGTCYTFNAGVKSDVNGTNSYLSKNSRNSSSYGPKNGLRIGMNTFPDRTLALLTPEFGARVVFHKPGTIPFPEDEGFTIPPGTSNSISIKPMKITRQPQPWGKCGTIELDKTFSYTKRLCEKQCIEKQYMATCNCYPGIGPAYANIPKNNLSRCNLEVDSVRLCMDTVSYNYSFGSFSCDCPISCNEWSYSAEFSNAANDRRYYAIIKNEKDIPWTKDDCPNATDGTVRLHVYFAKLAYQSVTASPSYSFDSLLSNLGGNFGLFIGVTVISIIELTEFFIDVFLFCFGKNSTAAKAKRNKYSQILLLVERIFISPEVESRDPKED